ncbi:MAG: hypothetical protein KDM81_04500, partial [Verrucomicrobiae bacterium]|nr:hypothetical protein [Verrucomicrobiae bacterium]
MKVWFWIAINEAASRLKVEHLDAEAPCHHDAPMRTTLTLDNDLAERLRHAAQRDGQPFKQIVNETLRAGLGLRDKPGRRKERFVLRTFRSRLKAGIDETKLNQLADQLEVESFLAETLKPSSRA